MISSVACTNKKNESTGSEKSKTESKIEISSDNSEESEEIPSDLDESIDNVQEEGQIDFDDME